LGPLPDFL
jgi:cyclin-dependent kinase-like